jgi:hypothetical protein
MTLRETLGEHLRACFTGLWVQSHEHEDALADIARLCHDEQYRLLVWDCDRGLAVGAGQSGDGNTDPLPAIHALSVGSGDRATLLLLPNFHRFLNNSEVVQTLVNAVTTGKQNRVFVVILSPIVAIPTELEKLFVVLEHELPSREQLDALARTLATEPGDLPDDMRPVLDASAGLTRYEAEAAYSLSLVRHGRIEPSVIWELKAGMLKKAGMLALHRGQERFNDLGGLESLKRFCKRALASNGRAKPRGVLLLGVPGTGKSAFAKALGNETGRPTLILDIGSLMGSLVGQSEENIRHALRIADAMAPCVLFVDEIEKGLAGVTGPQMDSGVSARLFGNLLTWLNDHASDVFFVGTCNNIQALPPEFSRAERFDGIFFLDLPADSDREPIWRMYLDQFGLAPALERPSDDGWTGAEIKACCRLAALLDLSLQEAALNVVPVSRTAADKIAALRTWADGKCLDAAQPGIYQRSDVASSSPARRNLVRPSAN